MLWCRSLIKVYLNGRAGNQLFQYAAARALSVMHNVPICYDVSAFKGRHSHYILNHFNTSGRLVGVLDNLAFCGAGVEKYEEQDDRYDPEFFSLGPKSSIKGYFQSEKYFSGIEDQIKDELEIKHLVLSRDDLGFELKIKNINSIAVHIRRTDYVGSAWDVCGKEYYYQAAAYIKKRVDDPVYFIFSDDIDWCRKNIHLGVTHYVESDASKTSTIKDLYLMAKCKHLIIPNSSFSWWGAWLCGNPNKIVVSPDRWSTGGEFSIVDKTCGFWHTLDV